MCPTYTATVSGTRNGCGQPFNLQTQITPQDEKHPKTPLNSDIDLGFGVRQSQWCFILNSKMAYNVKTDERNNLLK
jgi:hypothetical protein